MKILTANFVSCAVKACKTSPDSFPLHFKDAELEQVEMEYNPVFLYNILPRLEWDALKATAAELGFTSLPDAKPEAPSSRDLPSARTGEEDTTMDTSTTTATATTTSTSTSTAPAAATATTDNNDNDQLWRDLHTLLLETQVVSGLLECGSCGHQYRIRDGIANFLLPHHLV